MVQAVKNLQVAKKYQSRLDELKRTVAEAHLYFKPNIERYNEVREFVFKSNLTPDDQNNLQKLDKPPIQFNVLEAYISRLRGEFSKQEPSFEVHGASDAANVNSQVIEIIEGHMRAVLFESKKDSFEYNVYTDQLSGGFSAMKVWTEYENEKSFNQKIRLGRVFDPTLTGFDPMARLPHKGDGNFCYELFPKTRADFEEEYPNVDLSGVNFRSAIEGYSWSYTSDRKEILLVCDFYEKKKKRTPIYLLADNSVKTDAEYKLMLQQYEVNNMIAQPPAIVSKRTAITTTICRYRFIENQVIDYVETDYKYLPIIFVDGNSLILREGGDGTSTRQFTRPYVYNAIDAQKFKNVCGQTLANDIELMVAHKFKAAIESIPSQEEYQVAYKEPQKASTLMYNMFDQAGRPLNPPEEIMRAPIPPEVAAAFTGADQMIQSILGSYDAALGINNNQLSGVAIVEGATQSNAAAMPYIVSFLAALNQAAQIILDLIPKYYLRPMTIPIIDKENKKQYAKINQPGGVNMAYQASDLNVTVEAGVNFEIQKSKAIQTLSTLGQTFPAVNALINQKGLAIIFDNLDIRGADRLKQMAEEFTKQMAQQQQMQQQAAMNGQQNNPEMLKMQLEHQKMMQEAQFRAMELQLEQQKLENEKLKTALQYASEHEDNAVQLTKAATERDVHKANIALKASDQIHQHHKDAMDHVKDMINLTHTINQSTGDNGNVDNESQSSA